MIKLWGWKEAKNGEGRTGGGWRATMALLLRILERVGKVDMILIVGKDVLKQFIYSSIYLIYEAVKDNKRRTYYFTNHG